MAKQPGAPLSATFVRTITKPGRYGDGRGGFGLSLLVKPMANGRTSKSWSQRLRIDGRESNIGLGIFPVVNLAEARKQALANRQMIAKGRHPKTGATDRTPTFRVAVEKVIQLHSKSWKPGSRVPEQWRQTLRDYAFVRIGDKRVSAITTGDVLGVLSPIWTAKPSVARKVRQRIGVVLDWAVAKGYRGDNPAGDAITAALPRNGNRHTHHKAVPHGQVAEALAKVRGHGSGVRGLGLEFLVLTASRVGEVAGARWSEISGNTWTIPAKRVKTKRPHRVPLSSGALEVLDLAKALAGDSTLVFPGATGKPIPRQAFGRVMKAAGIAGTAHGFRSSFRNWAADNGVARELAERSLGHVVRNATEAAYYTTDVLERRRGVLERWAAYCEAP